MVQQLINKKSYSKYFQKYINHIKGCILFLHKKLVYLKFCQVFVRFYLLL